MSSTSIISLNPLKPRTNASGYSDVLDFFESCLLMVEVIAATGSTYILQETFLEPFLFFVIILVRVRTPSLTIDFLLSSIVFYANSF